MIDQIDAVKTAEIHLLDVGKREYGDSILCKFGSRAVLIDGAHPGDDDGTPGHASLPEQFAHILGGEAPYKIDLLIVSHAHQDHIGCLPKLISTETIAVDWALVPDPALGWGRSETDAARDFGLDIDGLKLLAALREEVYTVRDSNRADVEQILSDAVTLETTYKKMLDNLERQNTRVVRFCRDDASDLISEFSDIGLKIIGPPQEHVLICAEIIRRVTQSDARVISDVMSRDVESSLVDLYKNIIGAKAEIPDTEGLDAPSRPGPAINLQSIISHFEYLGHKFLFAGDFQFEDPEMNNDPLEASIARLRSAISDEAPYSFVKLSHHGSHNSFSESVLQELGETVYFGLCAGEDSTHHPSRDVLEVLKENDDRIKWARTDRNGLTSLVYKKNRKKPAIRLSMGELNDARPNDLDVAGSLTQPETPGKVIAVHEPEKKRVEGQLGREVGGGGTGNIEINVKIPTHLSKIRFSGDFTVELDGEGGAGGGGRPTTRTEKTSDSVFEIGGNRPVLENLLFVTDRRKLAENIGMHEAEEVLASFERQRLLLDADMPGSSVSAAENAERIIRAMSDKPSIKGVVIVGGYDIIPSQIVDCLPKDLRSRIPYNEDPDNFVVWSDDVYGDSGDGGLPEIPVSRVPDGNSATLLRSSLSASLPRQADARFGIRNVARPFAESIFKTLPGAETLHVSRDTTFDQSPPYSINGSNIYLMLHGDYVDASRFWGEGTHLNREAFNVNNIPDAFSGVVFTGCCWGALIVNTPGGLVVEGRPYGKKTAESSIALSFLARGANSFIGCTGAHYSPITKPFNYFGGPMHKAFWDHLANGSGPAESLLKAKIDYLRAFPHGRVGPLLEAIEYKILRQYTCLGLGW